MFSNLLITGHFFLKGSNSLGYQYLVKLYSSFRQEEILCSVTSLKKVTKSTFLRNLQRKKYFFMFQVFLLHTRMSMASTVWQTILLSILSEGKTGTFLLFLVEKNINIRYFIVLGVLGVFLCNQIVVGLLNCVGNLILKKPSTPFLNLLIFCLCFEHSKILMLK